MAQDLSSQLSLTADASGIEAGVGRAKRSLADLGVTAQNAGKQASAGLNTIGASGEAASKKVESATKNLVGSIQRQIATVEAGSKSGSRFFETLAQQRGVPVEALRPYLDQLDQVIAKQKIASGGINPPKLTTSLGATAFIKPLDSVGTSLGATAFGAVASDALKAASAIGAAEAKLASTGMTAKQTAAALRQVPLQFTDIVTSLAAGQAPLQVLLQQGGQLKDTFGGIGPAARVLGTYILGLVNPFTIAAGAAALLALAYKQGSDEADEFAKALILSGNAAGTTVGQLQGMAESISKVVGTQGKAAETLAAFAASGDIGAANLERFAQAAIRLERVTGQAIGKTVEQFASLAKEPLQAALKLNETTRFLTLSLYAQIKALDDVGRTADAAALAQRGYADALESRTGQLEARLGSLEKAWKSLGDTAKRAWDFMLNVGRPDTLESQLETSAQRVRDLQSLQQQLASGQRRAGLGGLDQGQIAAEIAAEQARGVQLSKRVDNENAAAAAAKIGADQVRARAEFDKDGVRYLSDRVKLEQEINKARQQGLAAGASQAEIDKRVADIRADFAKKQPKGPKPVEIDKSELQAQLAAAKNILDEQVAQFRSADSILEALRSAGLVNEKAYYAEKRRLIEEATQAEEDALTDQIAALEVANAAIERLSGRKREEKEPERIDNLRKVADAESQIARLREGTAAKLVVLSIQEEAAAKRLAASFLTARQAAQDFFDQTQRQQARDLEGFGQGQQQRTRNAGISSIEDRFADQRRELENQKALLELEGKFTEEARQQYDERLRIIQEFQAKSIASFNAYYDKLIEREKDARLGALEALRNYADEAGKLGKQIEGAIGNALKGTEDLLVDFFTKGKADLKAFAQSIANDLIRIIVREQFTGPLARALQGPVAAAGQNPSGTLAGAARSLVTGQPAAASANPAAAAALSAQTAQTSAVQQSKVALDSLAQAANDAAQRLGSPVPGVSPSTGFSVFDTSGAGPSAPSAERDVLRRIEAGSGETTAAAADLQSAFGGTQAAAYKCGQEMVNASLGIGRLGDASSLAGLALKALPEIIRLLGGGGSSGGGSIGGFLGSIFTSTTSTPSAERDTLRRLEAGTDPEATVGAFTQAVTAATPEVRDLATGSGEAASGLGELPQALSGVLDGFGDAFASLLASSGGSGGDGGWIGELLALFGGAFADGGRPPVNMPSIVGERGPELFIPDTIAATMKGGHAPVLVGVQGPQIIVPSSPGTVLSNTDSQRLIERIERERRIEQAATTTLAERPLPAPLPAIAPDLSSRTTMVSNTADTERLTSVRLETVPVVLRATERPLAAVVPTIADRITAAPPVAPSIQVTAGAPLSRGTTHAAIPHQVRGPTVLAAPLPVLGVPAPRTAPAATQAALAPPLISIASHVQAGHPVLSAHLHPQIALSVQDRAAIQPLPVAVQPAPVNLPRIVDRSVPWPVIQPAPRAFPVAVDAPQINLSTPAASRETRERFERLDHWRDAPSQRVDVRVSPEAAPVALPGLDLSPDLEVVIGKLRGLKFFADGGRPPMGRPSVVGENGPELFFPDRPGVILSNKDSVALSQQNTAAPFNVGGIYITVPGSTNQDTAQQIASRISIELQEAAARRTSSGGRRGIP